MTSSLIKAPLASICRQVTDGTHDSPRLQPTGIPFVKAKDVSSGRIDFSSCGYISYEDHLKVIARSKPEFGDTLFVNIGASLGDAVFVPNIAEFSIKNVALFKPDPRKVDPRYLYYVVTSPQFQASIKNHRSGSAQPFVGLDTLRRHEIEIIADLDEQRRIAATLSAYDDLIENNTRRIAILEEMARRLYEEWFVHFRFPGHEEAEFLETEIGRHPKEWLLAPFTDLADVLSGGTPKKTESEFWAGAIPFYTPKDAPSSAYCLDTENRITEAGLRKCNSRLYPKDTVFITARGTVGKVALASQPMAMNQSCYALQARNGYGQLFLFMVTRDAARQLKARSHGAVFDTIIVDTFRQFIVSLPSLQLAARYETLVRPIYAQLLTLERKNANLRCQRDMLLPKLISGEIDVSGAEKLLEAAE